MRRASHPPRRPTRLAAALALGALLVPTLPVIRVAAAGPVDVRGREIAAAVDHQRVIKLPFEASHVALRWSGSEADRVAIAFGEHPTDLGADVAVVVDEDIDDVAGEVVSGVIWTGGATFARITASRPLPTLRLLVMDAVGRRGPGGSSGGPVADAAVSMPGVISRAGWGANEAYRFDSGGYERFAPSFDPLQKVIVHHTAGRNDDPDPEATIRAIYYMHAVTRGYGDIDYNFLIDWQGRVYEGRHSRDYAPGEPITGEDLAGNVVRGAHARDFNDGTVGVALLGSFGSRLPPTAQRNALEQLIAWKLERHGIDPLGSGTYVNPVLGTTKNLKNISGHRDVNATACPGDTFYAWFPTLRQHVADRIAATTGVAVDHAAPNVLSLLPMVPDPSGATVVPFGLLFSEPVTGLDVSDLTVGGSSPGWTVDSVQGTASAYTVTVRAPPGDPPGDPPPEGSVALTLASDAVVDLAGNTGPAAPAEASVGYLHDPDAPSVVLWQTPHRTNTSAEFIDWTVTFSEPVLDFTLEDVVIGGPDADEWFIERVLGSGASYIFTTKQATLSDGTFTVAIPEGAVTDLAGNPGQASAVVKINADRTAPVTSTPRASLRSDTTLKGSGLRVNITWTGSDSGPSGISYYEVRRSYDGKAFKTIATGLTNPSLGWALSPGHTYRFEVRARDRAGNAGPWKAGPTLRPKLIQETASSIIWSGPRKTTRSTKYSGGSERYLAAAGSSATWTTKARSLSFITTLGPSRGTVRVYIDGKLAATVDLNRPTTTYRYVAFSTTWSSKGTHTIRVVSVGTPVPRVDVDAFGVIR